MKKSHTVRDTYSKFYKNVDMAWIEEDENYKDYSCKDILFPSHDDEDMVSEVKISYLDK